MRPGSFDSTPLCQPSTAYELRSALRSPATHRLLHETVERLLHAGSPRLTFRLQRVKCKPGRKLTLTYDVSVGGSPGRPVTVTWFAPGRAGGALDGVDDRSEDEARRRHVAEPFARLSAAVPEHGLRIQVSPHDPELGQLVRLVDPGHVRALLETTVAPGWGRPQVGWVRYRPGQRHVLCYRGPQGEGPIVFAKLHRGEGRSAATAEAMAEVLAAAAPEVVAAPLLAMIEADGAVLWGHQPGTPLSQLIGRGEPVDDALTRAGGALRRLHEAPVRRFGDLPRRDLDGEVRVTRRAAGHVARLLPAVGERIDALLDEAEADRESTVASVVVHGDLKADHLLVDGDRLSLLDFDSCALAEPALDLGKLLADLRYWFTTARRPGLEAAQRAFLCGYLGDPTVPDRARRYEALFLARAAARRLSPGDDDWEARTTGLTEVAGGLFRERVA